MATAVHPGRWFSEDTEGRLLCQLCPRACRLKPGDRGFCFVRQNIDGQMVLDTYGKSTGFCIDPIEKKPLNHFLPGTPVLSFGTAGCNLGCKFCQNWDISKSREVARLSDRATPEGIAQTALQHGCRSVAFTYNDPVIWAEYAIDTAAACRQAGLRSVAVTAGYITPEARGEFFANMDAANIDLKGFSEHFYHRLTGAHLEPVLDTIRYVCNETDCWVELTNLIIPQANDDDDELKRMCGWVLESVGPDVPVHFTAFHPDFRMRDRPATPHETLIAAHEIAREMGLHYAYVGNVHDVQRQSTYCARCGELLIERDWYELGRYTLKSNRCSACQHEIPGHFESQPGDWGRQRQPIRIQEPEHSTPQELVMIQPAEQTPETEALSEYERAAVHLAASRLVAAAVLDGTTAQLRQSLGPLSERPVDGVYVTLKRGETLRGCCGMQGRPMPLFDALLDASYRTARDDPRMPPISVIELPFLDLSVSVLGPPIPVTQSGDERIKAVTVGQHGLRIRLGDKAGLLLPVVATERNWSSRQFLDAVCRKAGLPAAAWHNDQAVVEVFTGDYVSGPIAVPDNAMMERPILEHTDLAQLRDWVAENLDALQRGATPSYYAAGVADAAVHGIALRIDRGAKFAPSSWLRLNLRDSMPLQSTLFQMTERAAASLRQSGTPDERSVVLALFNAPIQHGSIESADLRGIDVALRAMLVTDGRRWSLCYDATSTPEASTETALVAEPFRRPASQVYSLACSCSESMLAVSLGPQSQPEITVRPPAVAGTFYPADDVERDRFVDQILAELPGAPQQSVSAVMVPHAALHYSGCIAAEVWRRITIPEHVLIIGPKHTADGVDWAVAPHRGWELSSTTVMSGDVGYAEQLAATIPGMELDAAAHRREHGIEVQLPLLHLLAPQTQVSAIAMHGGTLAELRDAAAALAGWLKTLEYPPLLAISSDMNHFADDDENRRRDGLALQALASGDAATLLQVCQRENISMCGQLPAALVLLTLAELGVSPNYRQVAYATSADVTGDKSRVVGYAGVLL